MKAPFPFFGGKSRVAHIVWPRFGNVPNYVEPFAGSLAIMLKRPEEWPAKNETVNDLDAHIANFWRSLKEDPDGVAAAADWPVNEADLHARHQWIHVQHEFRERMHTDPHFFDVKIAGWWVWGISAWIGDNWCRTSSNRAHPELRNRKGITALRGDGTGLDNRRPQIPPNGIHALERKRPHIPKGGKGVHRSMPDVSGHHGASGRGINAKYAANLYGYMRALAERLRYVRVCCGQWHRILGPSPTVHIGITAVFLDPPYGVSDRDKVYSEDSRDVAADVRLWCLEHGDDKRLRIALCGYDGEHNELEAQGWSVVAWKASGGYARKNATNANRERIWFSPGCLQDDPYPLFSTEKEDASNAEH